MKLYFGFVVLGSLRFQKKLVLRLFLSLLNSVMSFFFFLFFLDLIIKYFMYFCVVMRFSMCLIKFTTAGAHNRNSQFKSKIQVVSGSPGRAALARTSITRSCCSCPTFKVCRNQTMHDENCGGSRKIARLLTLVKLVNHDSAKGCNL